MYTIYIINGDDVKCIYNDLNPSDDRIVISPKLTLTESNAGELTMKLPPTNLGIYEIELFSTEIIIQKKGEEIWRGRALNIKEDFNGNRSYTCEGELAYLNDTTQPQDVYEDTDTATLLKTYLDIHNEKSTENRQFNIGAVSVVESISYIYTNYENTLKAISDLVETFGGYIQVRRDDSGKRVLDWLKDGDRAVSPQQIRFGNNLLDFTRSFDSTEFCTVILPLGARLEDKYGINMSGIDGVDAYTTIEDVNDGSPYVVNQDSVKVFGWIEKVVHFDDIEDPEILYDEAVEYLKEAQFENISLEINAVDLSYLNVDYQYIRLSEEVRCISNPHGLNMRFPVTKISIPLDNPANTTFTMGYSTKRSMTLQPISTKGNKDDDSTGKDTEKIAASLEERLKKYCTEILDDARSHANALINAFTRGYITITTMENGSNELYVTDEPIPVDADISNVKALCNRYWRWNLNGLAYYDKNRKDYGDPNYIDPADGLMIGITMDGAIVADRITAGTLTAFVIRAGILRSNYGNSYWDLDTGELYIDASTNIGSRSITQWLSYSEGNLQSYMRDNYDSKGTAYDYYSSLTQTIEGFKTEVRNTYFTKSDAGDLKLELNTSIEQTANSIKATVAESGSKWDTSGYSGYTILSGYGTPSEAGYSASSYSYYSTRYLDQKTGYIYYPSGSSWYYIETLKTVQVNLQSQITQTAEEISSKVSTKDLDSEITQRAGLIRLRASNIIVSSTNFSVDENGTMTCKNATISGDITVGGSNNSNGHIYVKNSSGSTKVQLDSDGLTSYISDYGNKMVKYALSGEFRTSSGSIYTTAKYANAIAYYLSYSSSSPTGLFGVLESGELMLLNKGYDITIQSDKNITIGYKYGYLGDGSSRTYFSGDIYVARTGESSSYKGLNTSVTVNDGKTVMTFIRGILTDVSNYM